jgi:hypothetical protein
LANFVSGTEKCQVIQTSIGNTDFAIMDTPGFDDTTRSDAEILKVITEQLSIIRLLGYNLKGIVYPAANRRDSELREEYWGSMRRRGSTATRFDGTRESARGIVEQLLGKKAVVLKVQEELVDREMSLNQTAAGHYQSRKSTPRRNRFGSALSN